MIRVIKLISYYSLCFCGGYGSAAIVKEGLDEKKTWKIIVGTILMPLSIIGTFFGGYYIDQGEDSFDEKGD